MHTRTRNGLLKGKMESDFFTMNFGPIYFPSLILGNYLFHWLYVLVCVFLMVLLGGKERRNKFLTTKYGNDRMETYFVFLLSSLPKSVAYKARAKVVSNRSAIAPERKLSSFLSNLRGGLYVDVGASVGHYSLMLHSNFRQVIAFEPFGPTAKILRQNIHYSKVKNARIIEMAVSDEDGTAILHLSPHPDRHSLLGSSKGIQVRTCSLASFFKDEEIIDLVKVDVEGAEWKVLKGAEPILEKVNSWVIELHDLKRKKDIEEWFISHGYSIRWLDLGETMFPPHIYAWREIKVLPLSKI